MRGYSARVLTAASALDSSGVVGPNEVGGARGTNWNVAFGPGTSVGTVVIESAQNASFTGGWALEATVAWSVANKNSSVWVPGSRNVMRARVSVAVVGGTVDVDLNVDRG